MKKFMPLIATLGFISAVVATFLTWYRFDIVNINYTLWNISKYLKTDSARYLYVLITSLGVCTSFVTDIAHKDIQKLTATIAFLLAFAGLVFSVYYFFRNEEGSSVKIGVGFLLAVGGLAVAMIANVLFLVLKEKK